MAKYRKKPLVVVARQYTGTEESHAEMLAWGFGILPIEITSIEGATSIGANLQVTTIHGEVALVRPGDWIIAEHRPGRFYSCKPGIFEDYYELVEEEAT